MSCNDLAQKIGPYVDGELPPSERSGLEEHLDSCPHCRRLASDFQTLDRLTRPSKIPTVSPSEWQESLQAVRHEAQARGRNWSRMIPAIAVAALLLVGFFVANSFLANSGSSQPGSNGVVVEPAGQGLGETTANRRFSPGDLPEEKPGVPQPDEDLPEDEDF